MKRYLLSLVLVWIVFTQPGLAQTEIFNYKQVLNSSVKTLNASIQSINRTTGEVVFGGGDSRGPTTPGLTFTWIWGDGMSNNGFFPQTKKYADVTKNYIARAIANYSATEKDTVEVLVDFVLGSVTPVPLDPKLNVYIPNQPFSVDGIVRTPFPDRIFSAEARAQLAYLLHVGSTIEYDFVNSDVRLLEGKFEQYMFRDSLFPGAYALSASRPIAFGAGDVLTKGNIDYSSLCHEMGHNYTLNTPANYTLGGRLGGRAFPFYGEAIAQIFQQAAGYELINNYKKYGIDETLLQRLKANFMVNARYQRTIFNEYVKDGMPFSSWSKVPGYSYTDSKEAFMTFIVVAYKFMETAEQQGKGYKLPMKRMMQFLQRFNTDWVTRYDPQNDNAKASSFRATLWAAAMSQAFQRDMRADFRAINFPISDADWAFLNPSLLNVSENAINISANASNTASFSVLSNVISWSISSSQPWLTPGVTNGSGNQVITLAVTANPSVTSRTAAVTVSAAGFLDQTVAVIQAGATPTLAISAQSLSLIAAPTGPSSVSITSNTSWSVVSSQSWLTTTNSGTENQILSISATANTLASPRSATLTVSANGLSSQIIIVTQAGAPATLTTSVTSLTVEASGGTPSVNITSNTSWSVASSQPWLTSSPMSGTGNITLTLTAVANSLTDSRTATITLSANGATNQTVVVLQRGIIVTATENLLEDKLRIHPNPVSNILHIEGLPIHSSILLYDVSGRLLLQCVSTSSYNRMTTDNLPVGMYYLRVQSEQKTAVRRFIKIH
jgi:hypothetical protein